LFGGVERESAGEHGEAPEGDTLGLREEVMAPFN
jgi:hypothetical protein